MNTKNLNPKSNVEQLGSQSLILHEQLALKRLKELHQEAWVAHAGSRSLNVVARAGKIACAAAKLGAALLKALFSKPALMRQVAPGQPPVEWHAHEDARQLHAMRML
jgi:hypothetical protein